MAPSAAGPSRPGRCDVWWADLRMAAAAPPALLDAEERARRSRFRRRADADRFTLGAVLLRLAVARVTGAEPAALTIERSCPDCSRPHGRPRVTGSGLHLSVSHSGDRVAVAITAAGPVGVDVEARVTVDPDLGRRVLGRGESAASARDLLTYWVRKESVVKATGDGLRVPLAEVLVTRPAQPPRLLGYPGWGRAAAAMADLSPRGDHRGALTVLTARSVLVHERNAALLLG